MSYVGAYTHKRAYTLTHSLPAGLRVLLCFPYHMNLNCQMYCKVLAQKQSVVLSMVLKWLQPLLYLYGTEWSLPLETIVNTEQLLLSFVPKE